MMAMLVLAYRFLLAGVFIVAGVAKLSDGARSRHALTAFGVPKVLAQPFGILLPVAELVVAVALLTRATSRWGALGALAFLLLFVVGISINLARGRTPDCYCVGQLHASPVGWPTLARLGVLASIAILILRHG